MFLGILDYFLNGLPLIKYVNNNKTRIAGAVAALSGVVVAIAPMIPAPYDTTAMAISNLLTEIAQVIGTVGVSGILVKNWKKSADKKEAKKDAILKEEIKQEIKEEDILKNG
jgi:L-cysteine desulfidase